MTVSTYLKSLADEAILSSEEKDSINRSEQALRQKITSYFGDDIKEQFRFGSYDRGTILPRSMDPLSDVDYMIVFKDDSYRPQTYLDKLRRFVDEKYSRSEISQSHPTIQLELSHIRFELVPATRSVFYGLYIPKRDDAQQSWMATDPKDANASIIEKNSQHNFYIKPLVRLVKYWNAQNGYPYESFELEKAVVAYNFGIFGLYNPSDLKGYFFEFMESLSEYWVTKTKEEKIQRAKRIIATAKGLEGIKQWDAAEAEIKKLIPSVVVTRRTLLG